MKLNGMETEFKPVLCVDCTYCTKTYFSPTYPQGKYFWCKHRLSINVVDGSLVSCSEMRSTWCYPGGRLFEEKGRPTREEINKKHSWFRRTFWDLS
jgi:hypothetical protein